MTNNSSNGEYIFRMKTSKPQLKKRKLDVAKPAVTVDLVDITNTTDSQDLSQLTPTIKPNGSKLDRIVEETESSDEESSENSADAQDDIAREEACMRLFREEAHAWLLDHGKAFFHVECLQFLREQQRKGKENPSLPAGCGGFGGRRTR